jgi:hypothetical protein
MKTKKSTWRKINGKWVNLEDISKKAGKAKYIKCDENSQIYTYVRTNKKAAYKQNFKPNRLKDK